MFTRSRAAATDERERRCKAWFGSRLSPALAAVKPRRPSTKQTRGANMEDRESDKQFIVDIDTRARDLIKDLARDGYPDDLQLTIVGGALTILLAQNSNTEQQLTEGIAITREMIEEGAKTWFALKGRWPPPDRATEG
jgi:hypothetical protein